MPIQWYVLRSKPRKEDMVWQQVRERGIESFYPRVRVHPVNPRARNIQPYFPGYLFVHVDINQAGVSVFKWMPHTLGLVSFGGEPAYVPDSLINGLKKRIKEINAVGGEVFDGLKSGDEVFIHSGLFAGYEAIFDAKVSGQTRVRVLLQLLGDQRIVPVELDVSQIRQK